MDFKFINIIIIIPFFGQCYILIALLLLIHGGFRYFTKLNLYHCSSFSCSLHDNLVEECTPMHTTINLDILILYIGKEMCKWLCLRGVVCC